MASSRRTYDTDVITLRTVFAKSVVNSNIPALRVLTADGAGGTYWAIPSSLGQNPSFNEIITSAGTYTADLSYNRFRLLAGEGIGMVNGPAGSNQTTLFGKAFNTVDVSGGNSFYSFTNNTLTPFIRVATTGAIQARADPTTNTLFIDGPVSNPYIVSTGQYGFYQIKVTPQTSTITSTVEGFNGDFITANSPSTLLRMLGYNDIKLSTNVTTNSIFFTISTFTSKGYLDISAAAFSAYPSTLSTVSSLYVQQSVYSSTVASLSSGNGITFSTLQSSINGLAMSTGDQFYILSGLIAQRAYINQLNSDINTVNLNMLSTVGGLGTAGYISTPGGGGGITTQNLLSTVGGLGTAGYLSTSSATPNAAFLSSFTFSTGSVAASSIVTSSLLNYGTLSTHSLVVYGASTLRVTGLSYFENILSSYSVFTPTLGLLDATSGAPVFMTANNGTISFNGSGGNGGIIDTQIASTLRYSSAFSSIKFGFNAGYTGQSNNAIAIGNNAGSNAQRELAIAIGANTGCNSQGYGSIGLGSLTGWTGQGDGAVAVGLRAGSEVQSSNAVAIGLSSGLYYQGFNSIAIGANAGLSNQAPSSIVLSAMGDALNATTQGFFVAPVRTLFDSYEYTLGYNSTTKEVGMINNPVIPRFASVSPFSNGIVISKNYTQVLDTAPSYIWNFGPGYSTDGGSNYRLFVSWSAPDVTVNLRWYFTLSNKTQGVQYFGVTYSNTRPHTALAIEGGGSDFYCSGSYMDIMNQMTMSNGDSFCPLLYMRTSNTNETPSGLDSKLTFSLEVARSNF